MARAKTPKGHRPSDTRNPNQRGNEARDRPGARDGARDGGRRFTFTDWAAI